MSLASIATPARAEDVFAPGPCRSADRHRRGWSRLVTADCYRVVVRNAQTFAPQRRLPAPPACPRTVLVNSNGHVVVETLRDRWQWTGDGWARTGTATAQDVPRWLAERGVGRPPVASPFVDDQRAFLARGVVHVYRSMQPKGKPAGAHRPSQTRVPG